MQVSQLNNYSLVPIDYKKKNPNNLLYFYPTTLNVVSFAKKQQTYSFYEQLELAEKMAAMQNSVLVPFSCMTWRRKKKYSDHKISIRGRSFFIMNVGDLTATEKQKLEEYIQEMSEE